MLTLFLFLLALKVSAEVCVDTLSHLVIITESSAPANYTSLSQWCQQYGYEFGDLSNSDSVNFLRLRGSCTNPSSIAIRSINGIFWSTCLLTDGDFTVRFPLNPAVECAAPEAVLCQQRAFVGSLTTSTMTILQKTTRTDTITTTQTLLLASTRLKTLPCGLSTATGNTTVTATETDNETTTITSQPTVHCPAHQPRICPISRAGFNVLQNERSINVRADQSKCACQKAQMQLARVSNETIFIAADVVHSCLGDGDQRVWIGSDQLHNDTLPCLYVDSQGKGEIHECNVNEELPVLCKSECIISQRRVLIEQRADQFQICAGSSIFLIDGELEHQDDFDSLCNSYGSEFSGWLNYNPILHDAEIISQSNNCSYFEPSWVRSFNGSANYCQYVGYDGVAVQNYYAFNDIACEGRRGVWCQWTVDLQSTSTTGSVTTTTFTTPILQYTVTTLTRVSATAETVTDTDILTATTLRSLVLTPYTTSTTFTHTFTTTTTMSITVTSTDSMSTRTTTVFDK